MPQRLAGIHIIISSQDIILNDCPAIHFVVDASFFVVRDDIVFIGHVYVIEVGPQPSFIVIRHRITSEHDSYGSQEFRAASILPGEAISIVVGDRITFKGATTYHAILPVMMDVVVANYTVSVLDANIANEPELIIFDNPAIRRLKCIVQGGGDVTATKLFEDKVFYGDEIVPATRKSDDASTAGGG